MLVEQRSEEWFNIRKGKITGSELHKIMGGKEGALTQTAKTYLLEKVAELYGGHGAMASGQAIEWGVELEDAAISVYQDRTKSTVEKCSFIQVDANYGGSPDGKVGTEGAIEVKCPFNSVNHFKHGLIKTDEDFKDIATNYYYQCISHMICLNAQWCDFISYDPRVNDNCQMFIYRLHRNEDEITAIKAKIETAVTYMQELKNQLKEVIDKPM
jgi:putative phage-type endonuclease